MPKFSSQQRLVVEISAFESDAYDEFFAGASVHKLFVVCAFSGALRVSKILANEKRCDIRTISNNPPQSSGQIQY